MKFFNRSNRIGYKYLGFLTGQVKIDASEIELIIPFVNEFLKNVT